MNALHPPDCEVLCDVTEDESEGDQREEVEEERGDGTPLVSATARIRVRGQTEFKRLIVR